jgi:hypothetical protein
MESSAVASANILLGLLFYPKEREATYASETSARLPTFTPFKDPRAEST